MAAFDQASPDSATLRQLGNSLYRSAFAPPDEATMGRNAPPLRIADAMECISLYQQARDRSQSSDDWLGATKNKGMAHSRLASMPGFQERQNTTVVIHHYDTALHELGASLINGRKANKSTAWLLLIEESTHRTVASFSAFCIEKFSWQQRCGNLDRVALSLARADCPLASALLFKESANELFKQAVRFDEESNWSGCLDTLAQMYTPQEEAARQLRTHLVEEYALSAALEELCTNEHHLRCKAVAAQEVHIANELQARLLFELDELDMDLLWTVMDHFKAALMAAEDCGSEAEAEALSGQAELYLKVLKMPAKARPLFLASVRLAEAIAQETGQAFHSNRWYQQAMAGLEEIRQSQFMYDQKAIDAARAETLEKIKPSLDAINAELDKHDSKRFKAFALLKYVYEKHPPKCENANLPSNLDRDNNKAMQKAMLKAVTHYHTDRGFNKEAGIEWFVLCEEITKHLNELHGYFKGL